MRLMLTTRQNLSGELTEVLRERILSGKLPAGERINEVHLSESLGVSRTPLREALIALAGEDLLRVEPRRGFFVTPLDAEEFSHLYAIRAILDPQALRLAGLPDPSQVVELDKLNTKLGRETRPSRSIDLDDAWHLTLLRHCPNPVLLDLVQQFMRRTRRYEYAFMSDARLKRTTVRQHAEVMAAIKDRDLESAIVALRRNLETGLEPILAKLRLLEAQRGGTA
jgi:DNA-binding GntR family transcriptional regulator